MAKTADITELATKSSVSDDIFRLEFKIEQTKAGITKAIILASILQFLAVVTSVVSIVGFMLKK